MRRAQSNNAFSRERIIKWIKSRLGMPDLDAGEDIGVNVELANSHYDTAVDDAFKEYNKFRPLRVRVTVPVVPGQSYYPMYVGHGIEEVQVPQSGMAGSLGVGMSLNLGDGLTFRSTPYGTFSSPPPMGPSGMPELYEKLVHQEMLQRIISQDCQWEPVPDGLWISKLPSGATCFVVIYNDDHHFDTVPKTDQELIEKASLAIAKQMLGEIRSKYPVTGPGGQQMIQRALDLLAEGQREWDTYSAEMEQRAYALPPTWGESPNGP